MMIASAPRRRVMAAILGLVVVGGGSPSLASGFFISQQSVPGAGRAFAGGAAAAEDASTIFTNPAGLTRLNGPEAVVGVSVITPRTEFENRGSRAATPATLGTPLPYAGGVPSNGYDPSPVPSAYLALPLPGDRVWVGVGVTAPFGIGVRFPQGWFGRYDAIRSELTTVDLAPTLAIKLADWLSVGGGVNVQYADALQTTALPNPFVPGGPTAATDGRSRLEGDDWSVGFNVGMLVTVAARTRIGVHYRSAITHELEGKNTVQGLSGPLAAANGRFTGRTDLKLPDIVSAAAVHGVGDALTAMAEVQWFNWSRFDEVRAKFDDAQPDLVIPQRYRDSYAFSLGLEYQWLPSLRVRSGIRYQTSPVRDRYRTTPVPDAENYSLGVGASWTVLDGVTLDGSMFGTIWDNAKIDLTRQFFGGTGADTDVNVRARAESTGLTVALGVRWIF